MGPNNVILSLEILTQSVEKYNFMYTSRLSHIDLQRYVHV